MEKLQTVVMQEPVALLEAMALKVISLLNQFSKTRDYE
jgi:dihydroneopterin aldolase